MYIYNTTFLVSHNKYADWYIWLREKLIPRMLQHDFTKPQVAKVHAEHAEEEGTSISVQFHVSSKAQIEKWQDTHGQRLQKEMSIRFGQEVLFFSTVLEIL